jgi:dipeptidyl aminopeptidase/acylaminoacyl peptidase
MTKKMFRPFGLWESPISPRSVSEGVRLEAARFDTESDSLVWLEGRSGRGVLLADNLDGQAPRRLNDELSVRAEVGYGGGDFTVAGGGVYFVVHKTGRIYRQSLSAGSPAPITPPFGKAASPTVSPDGKWIAYVHHDDDDMDRLAIVDSQGRHWPQILTSGADFYMQPRWSPDGRSLAWIAWDHPNMPWDGTRLHLARVELGRTPRLEDERTIAGGDAISIFQPEFTPDGKHLVYVSDETGWWRLAIHDLATGERRWLTPDGIEYGDPAWAQDMRTYAVAADGKSVLAAANHAGFHRLERIDLGRGQTMPVAALAEYTKVVGLTASPSRHQFAFVGGSPTAPGRVVLYDGERDEVRIVARSESEMIPRDELSPCEAISWPTAGEETAHGLFYPPANSRFTCDGKPPLVVIVHGGPTSQVKAGWSPEAQFLATRGFAVLYVNYRGGTGYGREYMLKLRGAWGVCDVEDSISGARHLADAGRVDTAKLVIMGGSAGGFTVLQAMTRHPRAFAAGICLYGVADQFHLAAMTHKFESRYLDTLLGPLPQAAEVYRERSPVLHADRIERPLAIFQGADDRVVPKEQSEMIVAALSRRGTPHEYHLYEGEGHGWRKQETIENYFAAVESFLRKYVVFA